MSILIYAGDEKTMNRLLDKICPIFKEGQIETFHNVEHFYQRLLTPLNSAVLSVVAATTRTELDEILLIRDLIQEIRIILILPDRNRDTVSGSRCRG